MFLFFISRYIWKPGWKALLMLAIFCSTISDYRQLTVALNCILWQDAFITVVVKDFTQPGNSVTIHIVLLQPPSKLLLNFFFIQLLTDPFFLFLFSDYEVVYRNQDGHVIKFNFDLNETEVILSNSTFVSFTVFLSVLQSFQSSVLIKCLVISK